LPCSLGRRPWGNRLSPCSIWRTTLEQVSIPHRSPWWTPCQSRWMCSEGTADCGEAMQEGFILKDCSPWKDPRWSRGQVEEGAAEMKHYELTAIPIPHPPVPLGVWEGGYRGVRNEGVKLSLGRRGYGGGVIVFLCFSTPNSFFK